MKTFLKNLLSAFFAAILSVIILFAILIYIFSTFSEKKTYSINRNSILRLTPDYVYKENKNEDLEEIEELFDLGVAKKASLFDILESIENAKKDEKIKGIFINPDFVPSSFAALTAIRKKLKKFKESGKFIVAYSEYYSLKAYYLASIANKVYLNPAGKIEWKGLSISYLYYKGLLDKLGVEAQIFKCGKYKSAVEPFSEKTMSDENRRQLSDFIFDRWFDILYEIAKSRSRSFIIKLGLDEAKLDLNADLVFDKEILYSEFMKAVEIKNKGQKKELFSYRDSSLAFKSLAYLFDLADNKPILNAEEAFAFGFIDGKKYYDEILKELQDSTGIYSERNQKFSETEDHEKLSTFEYEQIIDIEFYSNYLKEKRTKAGDKNKIAVVFAEGEIYDVEFDDNSFSGYKMAETIRVLRVDKSVKAIVLRVNSPGGSALASELIWREIELAKKTKPVVASMGAIAASGGYYIACGASYIYSEEFTLTGSIGVFAILPSFQGLLNDKLGITSDQVKTNKYSDLPDVNRKLSDDEKKIIQKQIEETYDLFLTRVSEGRGIDKKDLINLAEGRIYSARKALEIKLADEIGDLDKAIAKAANLANISEYEIVKYPKKKKNFAKYLDLFLESKIYKYVYKYEELEDLKRIAKLPYYNNILALCEIIVN